MILRSMLNRYVPKLLKRLRKPGRSNLIFNKPGARQKELSDIEADQFFIVDDMGLENYSDKENRAAHIYQIDPHLTPPPSPSEDSEVSSLLSRLKLPDQVEKDLEEVYCECCKTQTAKV